MANVKVRLKDASGNVLHPETEWSLVQSKPSIFTYPVGAGTCIGDVSGFRVFYTKGKFLVCVTAGIAEGDYTLGFATPGSTMMDNTGKKEPIAAFFVNIVNLTIDSGGIVDSLYHKLNLISGEIESNYALGIWGRDRSPLLDLITHGNPKNILIDVDNSANSAILPVSEGGALCIGAFEARDIEYGEYAPYLMMVAKLR